MVGEVAQSSLASLSGRQSPQGLVNQTTWLDLSFIANETGEKVVATGIFQGQI